MNHESDLCTNVSERLCLLTIWHCCEVTKHMHASMPNASFNALLRSNCLRFRRWVFNICMRKKLPKTTMAWSFEFDYLWLSTFIPLCKWHLTCISGFTPSETIQRETVARADLRQTPGELQGKPFQYLGSADGVRLGLVVRTVFLPPSKICLKKGEPPWNPYDMFQVKILECVKTHWSILYVLILFFAVYIDMIFLVPKASTWFLRDEMTSIKISIFVNFLEPPKAEHNWH